jgi:hypothetical protein
MTQVLDAALHLAEQLRRLRAMPAELEAALGRMPAARWSTRPSAEAFSLVEQACHLRDLEREGYLVRVQRILAESHPGLEGFDGAAVAAARDYRSQDAQAAVQDFASSRAQTTELLAGATRHELDRTASFGGKRISLRDLVAMMLEHDAEHRGEIEALLLPDVEA